MKYTHIILIALLSSSCLTHNSVTVNHFQIPLLDIELRVFEFQERDTIYNYNGVFLVKNDKNSQTYIIEQYDAKRNLISRLQYFLRDDILCRYETVFNLLELKEEVMALYYRQPLPNGRQNWYYEDGTLKKVEYYLMGVPDSIWIEYDSLGGIKRTINKNL